MSYFSEVPAKSSDIHRERIFALRSMLKFAEMGASSDVTSRIMQISLRNKLYRQTVRSLIWELEVPTMMFAVDRYKGFPWRRSPSMKKKINKMVEERLKHKRAHCEALKDPEMRRKAEKRVEKRQLRYEHTLGEIDNPFFYFMVDSEPMREALQSVDDLDSDDFTSFDVDEHLSETMQELFGTLPEDGESLELGIGLVDYLVADFNTAAWAIIDPLKESICKLITDSWQHHALFLVDALSTFDFKPNRVCADGILAVENVPLDVSEAYLKSFQGICEQTHALIEVLRVANKTIGKIKIGDVNDDILQNELTIRRERYLGLQDELQIFADRIQRTPESVLYVCDCSPTGLLNSLMPIV